MRACRFKANAARVTYVTRVKIFDSGSVFPSLWSKRDISNLVGIVSIIYNKTVFRPLLLGIRRMSSNTLRARQLASSNVENPIRNNKNNLITNRKQNALKVLTNTVQSIKKSDDKNLKQSKVVPMKKFDAETKCKSVLHNTVSNQIEELGHFDCMTKDEDFLPASMTCNIDMLSNFFGSKNNNDGDFFFDDYNNVMINKIKDTFDKFGEPDIEYCLPSLPLMNFNFPGILNC